MILCQLSVVLYTDNCKFSIKKMGLVPKMKRMLSRLF
jgi:hypothetical protein